MRIAVIGDVHDHRARLEQVLQWIVEPRPELALLVGDVGLDPDRRTAQGPPSRRLHDDSVRGVMSTIRAALGCPLLFVPGNHDLPDPAPDVDAVNCDGRVVELHGLRIAGFGGAEKSPFRFPYEWEEPQADAALRRLLEGAAAVDILICHAPPARTALDRIHRGLHVGSEAVRSWIVRSRPGLAVCGHIHEAWGIERLSGVPCLNAGGLGEPFGEAIGWVVGWSGRGPASLSSYRSAPSGGVEVREWI